jgi:tetratricopeptide (TPR) repeat protein
MDRWYANGERRRAIVSMADVIYRAGAGDTSVLPDVVRLAVDRSHGALIRASAAEFGGQLIQKKAIAEAAERAENKNNLSGDSASSASSAVTPTIINALIGASADPEAMVRITAVRALGFIDDQRTTQVLAAHLTDTARLVRVSAAEALLERGIARLDGAVGAALRTAQDEWAESLRTFNDVAADHTNLGRLYAARGLEADAIREFTTATKLDSSDPRPRVRLGVLAARAGRYDEALKHFTAAKSLAPSYPNIEQLIAEVQKRRRGA